MNEMDRIWGGRITNDLFFAFMVYIMCGESIGGGGSDELVILGRSSWGMDGCRVRWLCA
jgi:hypothetical protein